MPSTLFPVAIDESQLLPHFSGLGDVLEAAASAAGTTAEELFARWSREAVGHLEQICNIPFFETRFCTREIASQNSLVLGTHFDRYVEPLNYIVNDWRAGTARTVLTWRPLKALPDRFAVTLSGGGQITDIPIPWLQPNYERAELHVIPQQVGLVFNTYLGLLFSHPLYRPQAMSIGIPNVLHVRYTAGLVDPTDYDPTAEQKATIWSQEQVYGYQHAIAARAAGKICELLAGELDNAGVQVSLDGLGEWVNPEVLGTRAQKKMDDADKWAQNALETTRGLKITSF